MSKKIILKSMATIAILSFSACVANQAQGSNNTSYENNTRNTPINNNSRSTLSPALKNTLSYMYHEERLAKDIYLNVYQKQPLKQLYNIATKAETKHINAVDNLAQKYGITGSRYPSGQYPNQELQALYNKLYAKGIRSKRDALEVGCIVEVVDINDLNKYIGQAQASNAQDVTSVFEFLRKGSYNHYWAFDKGLKAEGVNAGCCSLGQAYCHPEYPKKSKGQGRGQGQGQGMGRGQGGGWRNR